MSRRLVYDSADERHDSEHQFAKEAAEPLYPAHVPTRGTHRNMAREQDQEAFSVDSNDGRAVSERRDVTAGKRGPKT